MKQHEFVECKSKILLTKFKTKLDQNQMNQHHQAAHK